MDEGFCKMTPPEIVTDKEILSCFLRKKLFPKKHIVIQVPNLNTVALHSLIECYLFISGVRFSWKDASNRTKSSAVSAAVGTLIGDVFDWLGQYNKVSLQVSSLQQKEVEYFPVHEIDSCLFLRTDHWFGVKGGGSVSHLQGDITGFRINNVTTKVISSDYLVGVPSDDNFTVIEPNYTTCGNVPEMPDLLYNLQLQQSTSSVPNQKPSFIYQRYSLGNFFGVYLKYKYKVPFVCEYNGSFVWIAEKWNGRKLLHNSLMHSIEMLNLRHADVIVVVSEVLKEELISRGIGAERIFVNPNGVHPDLYSPEIDSSKIRTQYSLQNKFVYGFLGTFGPWHGTEVLTEAFGKLLQQKPDLKGKIALLLVGDGKTMPLVQQVIEKYSIQDSVILSGLVPQEQGPFYLAACDVLVSPNINNPDNSKFFCSPIKLFEYMSMSKPIIASDLEQLGEILQHEETALLTEPGNVEQLTASLYTLYTDKELRDSIAIAARKEAIEKHTWEMHTKKTLDFLKSL